MKKSLVLLMMGAVFFAILFSCALPELMDVKLDKDWNQAEVYAAMDKVGSWQMRRPATSGNWVTKNHWIWGSGLPGFIEWNRIALAQTEKETKVQKWLLKEFDKVKWELYKNDQPYHADNHVIGWSYLELRRDLEKDATITAEKKAKMVADLKKEFDWILKNPSSKELEWEKNKHERWSWCDALYMAPPTWLNLANFLGDTEGQKYLEFANKEFWATTEYLFDNEYNLYFRDSKFFPTNKEPELEANGKPVFWGRGNSWVLAAMPRILKYLPEDFADRAKYIELYQKLAKSVIEKQCNDGFWRPSLLDPDSYRNPEASCTGFFCYGLWAGINMGILDEATYRPAALKSWNALQSAVHDDGKLGWVQPVGEDPKHVNGNMYEVYGVGAYLLAGSEYYRYLGK